MGAKAQPDQASSQSQAEVNLLLEEIEELKLTNKKLLVKITDLEEEMDKVLDENQKTQEINQQQLDLIKRMNKDLNC